MCDHASSAVATPSLVFARRRRDALSKPLVAAKRIAKSHRGMSSPRGAVFKYAAHGILRRGERFGREFIYRPRRT
jgi:hypothetical protein